MPIKRKRGWELPDSAATPEHVFVNRRHFMAGAAAALALPAQPAAAQGFLDSLLFGKPEPIGPARDDPTWPLYPAGRNEAYRLDRDITPEELNQTYNNFYEYGSSKYVAKAAQQLKLRPWEVAIDGMVEQEMKLGIDDLLNKVSLEERLYRHRCVEAWAMAIPWTGFPMKALLDIARPLSSAKYVRMETFMDLDMAPGQRNQPWYPWPYVEGVTIEEAANELAFMVTGAYGKPLPKQMGAPLRLALPWKYGFKSIKSLVRFTLTDQRPVGLWEKVQSSEYGFWANVNPEVPHPRWSQARETVLGSDEKVPTQVYNGYGEYVAGLYRGMEGEKLFM